MNTKREKGLFKSFSRGGAGLVYKPTGGELLEESGVRRKRETDPNGGEEEGGE